MLSKEQLIEQAEKFLEDIVDTNLERDINQAIGRLEMTEEEAINTLEEFITYEIEYEIEYKNKCRG
jgi:hypothetical protein